MISRRLFLRVMLLSGAAIGCRQVPPPEEPSPTGSPLPDRPMPSPSATRRPTLQEPTPSPTEELQGASAVPAVALDTRFAVQNEAVDYSPWPEGCDGTFLVGQVLDANGEGVSGLRIRIWDVASGAATVVSTDANGAYQVHIAEGLTDAILNVQLLDANGMTVLSDVVHAPVLPDCGLNQMTITFVATP